MASVFVYMGDLILKTVTAILNTLAHNVWVLAFGIITAVALKTYVNTERLSGFLLRRTKVSIFASVSVGAFTPFCACGTMAVVVGMLTTTLPWGPVMAFLTSSPLMSPDGFVMVSGLLGLRFAVALTLASLIIGVASGFVTHIIEQRTGFLSGQSRYMKVKAASSLYGKATEETYDAPLAGGCGCTSNDRTGVGTVVCYAGEGTAVPPYSGVNSSVEACCAAEPKPLMLSINGFAAKLKLRELFENFVALGLKQILLYFSIFVGVGYLVNTFVPDSIISVLFGSQSVAAVPLASLIGLPLYLTTESGIPIIQSLLASGASEGAMLSFIITGSATSAWVISGLTTFMKKRAIALYVLYIILGGILLGYLYDLVLLIL